MKTFARPRRRSGFTLMELMVVVSIIVVLAGLTLGGLNYVNAKQAREKARIQIQLLQSAMEDYATDHSGQYPGFVRNRNRTRSNGLNATRYIIDALFPGQDEKVYCPQLDPTNDSQGWLSGSTIVDPWGNEYYFRVGDQAANPDFDLWSAGPDGETNPRPSGNYDPKDPKNRDDIRGW